MWQPLHVCDPGLCNCDQTKLALFATLLVQRYKPVLQTIALVLIVMWLLGMVTSYTLGGFIHILLVLAVVSVLIRLINGRQIV